MLSKRVTSFLALLAGILFCSPCPPVAVAQDGASISHESRSPAAGSSWTAQRPSQPLRRGPVTPADLTLQKMQSQTTKPRRFAIGPLSASNSIFLSALDYRSSGRSTRSVAYGDLNGDGKVDLVLADWCNSNDCSSGTVSVLLGNGDATFRTAVGYNAGGQNTISVVLGDVNNDGNLDVVVSNNCSKDSCNDGSASVLLGNGDGTLQTAVSYDSGGSGAQSVVVGDVNGDGKTDLLVANNCAPNNSCANGLVSVLLGTGDGTFQTAVSYSSGGKDASSIALADINGDGKVDAVVTNNCASNNCTNGSVSVLLGNGDGTFQNAVIYDSGGQSATSVVLGDVNGDGKSDIVVANNCASTINCSLGWVTVLLGNGDGTFQQALGFSSGGQSAVSVAAADINGDGKPDLVVANQYDGNGDSRNGSLASVLLGNGDGTFQSAVNYASGDIAGSSLAIVDVDGDHKLDVVMTNQCSDAFFCVNGEVVVLLGNGDGTLRGGVNYNPGESESFGITVADVNADGKADLLVASGCNNNSCTNGAASVLFGNGDGTFQTGVSYGSGGLNAYSIASADLNGDGNVDLVVGNECADNDCLNGSVSVLLGNGDGTYQPAVAYGSSGTDPYSVAIADVNGDGRLDLVVANDCTDSNNCSKGSVGVLLGNGDGTFQTAVSYNSGAAHALSVAVADVNSDGKQDLLVANECLDDNCGSGGEISVLLGNGDGTFQPAVNYSSGGSYGIGIAVGDLNGDGKIDLIVSNLCSVAINCTNSLIAVLLGNGDGTFQAATTTTTPIMYAIQSPVVGDFNGDHKLDVVSGIGDFLLLGNGDGTFQSPISLGASGVGIAVGDFNGDGRPDLAVGGVSVLLNISSGFVFPTTTTVASSANPSQAGESVTLTATVAAQVSGTVTGTVTFNDGATVLGQATLSSGIASFSTASLQSGSHSITASYAGDAGFTSSVSAALSQVVQKAVTNPGFSLSSSAPSPASVAPGSSARSTITINPTGGFNSSAVNLSCSVSPKVSAAVNCSLGAISVVGGTGSSTLTVTTTGPVAALRTESGFTKLAFALFLPGFLFVGGAGVAKSSRRKRMTVGFVFLVLTACMMQMACAGASSSGNRTTTPGTPAGTYTVTVTGSASAMQQTTSVSLSVQ